MSRQLHRSLRLYVKGAWYSYRALVYWLTPFAYISSKVALPLSLLAFFTFMGRFAGLENQLYIVTGNILLFTANSGIFGVMVTVGNERIFRTLPYILGSPAPRMPLFLGRALFNTIEGALSVVGALVVATLFFGLDLSHTNPFLVFGCILLISLTCTGFGLILGGIALLTREMWTISNIVYLSLFLLCGVNFPIEALPTALQYISHTLPLTRGIAAARLAFAGGDWNTIVPLLGSEALVGLVYAIAGYGLFRYIEKQSRVSGQLEFL